MFIRYFGLVLVFVLLVWLPVESAWAQFCFNNYDLGIYSQTVQLLGLSQMNPWLSTRDLHIFNDHFEPVHFFAAMFRSYIHPSLLIIRLDMLGILFASTAPLWLAKKLKYCRNIALIASSLILFSPLILDAAFFPAHPGTWSLAPFAWMFAFLFAGLDLAAIAMLILVFMCKEEYPVVGIAAGVGLLYSGRKKVGLWFVVLSVLWFIGVFFVRPLLIGPADMYTQAVSKGSGLDLFMTWDTAQPILMRFLQVFAPLGAFWSLIHFRNFKQIVWTGVLCLGALLFVRLAGGFWGNHRSAPLGVAVAFVILGFVKDAKIGRNSIVAFVVLTIALAFPSLEVGSRYWRGKSFKKHCPNNSERVTALEEVSNFLRTNQNGTVVAQGNLVPRLVDIPGIAQIGATKSHDFKYYFAEKSQFRNTWPLSVEDFAMQEKMWRESNVKILRDDEYVLLIER